MPRISADTIAEHKEQTRNALFEAARSLIMTHGYEAISHSDITAYAGIARTTFYDYFTSKDDLLAALVEATLPEVIEDLVVRTPGNIPPLQRLQELSISTLEFMVRDPFLGLILHRDVPKLSAEAQNRIAVAHAQLGLAFATIYRAGIADGSMKVLPGRLSGRFIEQVIMVAAKELIETADPQAALPEVESAMIGLLLGGIGSA